MVSSEPNDGEVLGLLRPYVREWFLRTFGSFTPPQRLAIPEIKRGCNVLVSSPTGTGKTLAVFLALLDELYRLGEEGALENEIYVVYVSPLRALNNDMRKNLIEPIRGIRAVAGEMGVKLPEIRVAVRTSDTTSSEKQKMLRNPPHILITTPESLAIALAAPKFKERLRSVRWVIIDEIHELCSSKRGVHLSLSLERLEELAGRRLVRIGLSATIAPLEEVALYLVGFNEDGSPRGCRIVDARFAKPFDIRVVVPVRDMMSAPADKINEAIYRTLAKFIEKNRSTLVFTNTRSSTERVVYKLRQAFKDNGIIDADEVEAHHSSLSRSIRLDVEDRLKRGQLRAVVCSTSLELGIDIGYIDMVVLLSSPKSVSRLLQRVGRSGHRLRRVSKGRLIVVDRDDLVECTVLAKAAMERRIDRVRIPRNALDVLAQHLVGMALERKWRVEEAYRLVRRSYNYRDLPFDDFLSVLRYLAGKHSWMERHNVYAKIWLDEKEGVFGRRGKNTRMIYFLNSGTIPDEAKIKVRSRDGRFIGFLEEAFLQILTPGDIFVLGGRTYEFLRSRGTTAIVRPATGQRPTVPTWFSEMLPLSFDSAILVSRFRRLVAERIRKWPKERVLKWLMRRYRLERHAAESIYNYFMEQILFTNGLVPSDKLLLIEVFDEGDRWNMIFHSLIGRRGNSALGRAYGYIASKMARASVGVTITDNGFMLTFPRRARLDPRELVGKLNSENLRDVLIKALQHTELLARIFRHCAVRSFMILRRYYDAEKSVNRLQLNAQNLLSVVRDIPDFPVLKEAYREILEDKMDVEAAEQYLRWIEKGKVKVEFFGPTPIPTPFAHGIVTHGYSDVVLMEDRKKLLERLHQAVLAQISGKPNA